MLLTSTTRSLAVIYDVPPSRIDLAPREGPLLAGLALHREDFQNAKKRVQTLLDGFGYSVIDLVTGAYEPASGTYLAISFMMSGLPISKRIILGTSRPISFRKTAP